MPRRKAAEYYQSASWNIYASMTVTLFWLWFAASVCEDIATKPLAEQMSMFTRCLIPLQRKGIRNKERENDATKPFGFSDRSITISREYKCLREQPTDAVQFGVGPALPFNLVASSLLISFHRPAPTIPNLCNFSFRSCPSI